MTAGRVIRKYVFHHSRAPVVPVLLALDRTTRLPADQGRRHQVGGPPTDLRWDLAAPLPCPPGRLRRARSCGLLTQGSLLDRCGDVHERVAGWDHQMTGCHVLCSARDRASGEHAEVGGTEIRVPGRNVRL